MEFFTKLAESAGGIIALSLAFLLASNAFLSGLHKALEIIKDKTKTDADNKAHEFTAKVLGWLQIAIDLIKGNFNHKNEEIKIEEKKAS